MSAVGGVPSIFVLHKGTKHKVPIGATLGHLRSATEVETKFPSESLTFLVRGKKVGIEIPDETPLSDLKLRPGVTVMLSLGPSGATSGKTNAAMEVDSTTIKVRAVDGNVEQLSSKLDAIVARVDKLGLGFVDKEKTPAAAERIRQDCKVVEEGLMRAMFTADGLTAADDAESKAGARWRAERKAVVLKSQQVLRRCDEVGRRLNEMVVDTFNEMQHRRGSER